MRALKVAIVVAIGCVAASCDDPSSGAADATPDGGAETAGPVACCKLDPPSCDCPVSGTSRDGSCRRGPCDVVPDGWTTAIDERGCPYYNKMNSASCFQRLGKGDPPVGTACSTDSDCDPYGGGYSSCSSSTFGDATGACIRMSCDVPGSRCDDGRGVCVRGESCLPRCSFGDDGAAPTGCRAGVACWSFGRDPTTSAVRGDGYCLGGCTSDGDCATGWRCQPNHGFCLPTLREILKNVGEPCASGDKCLCMRRSTSAGYCTQFCRVGADAMCPAGFICDPALPAEFTTAPVGLAGTCARICTADDECTTLNATCVAAAGLSTKVCRPK